VERAREAAEDKIRVRVTAGLSSLLIIYLH